MLSVYLSSGEEIPLDLIDIFWRKLSIFDTKPEKKGNICCDDEVEKYKENFNKQTEAGKKFYLKKLKEIYDPRTIDVGEPTVQNKTRGRPSMKKQHKKNVNPPNQAPPRCNDSTTSEFIGLDLNKEPERHNYSYAIDLNEEPRMHDPFLMKSIPDVFHDYIDKIQDVLGDGNCGFRAVAVSLGHSEDQWLYIRQQLLEELESQFYAYQQVFTDGFNEVYESLCWFESPAYL
ncbi:unnamed protein product [Lactuca saligna]|uniref:OTU domain-containing protein n=1 Tax=Lactuca saligna TaxID=75948 RepID=A0AA35ZCN8_LACSI|nr:unnamed protein product [Lactuca saligna]